MAKKVRRTMTLTEYQNRLLRYSIKKKDFKSVSALIIEGAIAIIPAKTKEEFDATALKNESLTDSMYEF